MVIQFAVQNDMTEHQLHVKTVYLNAPIDCEVYVCQPDGFEEEGNGNDTVLVWRLVWNTALSSFLHSKGFKQSRVDTCLFIQCNESGMIYML